MGRRMAMLGLGMVLLSGCAAQDSGLAAGQAAVSDAFTISQADVDAEVSLVLRGRGEPEGTPAADLASQTTERLVQDALVAAKAAELGVSVTPAQVQDGLTQIAASNGGREGLDQVALQAGIAPESVEDVVRTQLLFSSLAAATSGGQEDGGAALQAELTQYSEDIDVQVAPRYGTWSHMALRIDPTPAVVEQGAPGFQP